MQEVFGLTHALLERNPYALEAMPVHLTAALELRKKNELFLRGHRYAASGACSERSCAGTVIVLCGSLTAIGKDGRCSSVIQLHIA